MMISNKKKGMVFALDFLIAIVLIFLDQYTKHLAIIYLKEQKPVFLWENILHLQYLENRGAAFGILQGQKWLIVMIGLIALAGISYALLKIPIQKRYIPLRISLIFISAGAIGNIIDRLTYHFVVDFIYFVPIDFPIFNVADCYVTMATLLLIFLILFYYKEEDFAFLTESKDPRKSQTKAE